MKRIKGNWICIALLGMLFFSQTMFGPMSSMAAAQATPFNDVKPEHWALKYIVNLTARGVLTGYGDGTFQPDKPVTQLEAVLMAVRNMEQDAAVTAINGSQTLPFTVPEWANQKFKKELLFAIDKGLIIPSENNFTASANASRAWMTQLMVRMIGKQNEVVSGSTPPSEFTDGAQIPSWAVGYVNTALKYSLISGFPDHSFKPDQFVTRAQSATLLTRSETYLPSSSDTIYGVIAAISASTIGISSNNNIQGYSLVASSYLFDGNDNACTWNAYKPGDYVKLVLDGSKIKYGSIAKQTAASTVVKGEVVHMMIAEQQLVVKSSDNQVSTWQWTGTTKFVDAQNQVVTAAQVMPGLQVELTRDAQGKVSDVKVLSTGSSALGDGVIKEIVAEQKLIILQTNAGTFASYLYSNDLQVIVPGLVSPGLAALKPGDSVKITAQGSQLSVIELVRASSQTYVTGTIMVVSPDQRVLVINSYGDVRTYVVPQQAAITVPGISMAGFSDIQVNDQVSLSLLDSAVTAVAVTFVSSNRTQGTVASIRTAGRQIVLSGEGESTNRTYDIAQGVDVNIVNLTNAELSDIEHGDYVDLELSNHIVTAINVRKTYSYTIISIDRTIDRIKGRDDNSNSRYIYITNDVTLVVPGVASPNLGDFDEGDDISATYLGSLLLKVEKE